MSSITKTYQPAANHHCGQKDTHRTTSIVSGTQGNCLIIEKQTQDSMKVHRVSQKLYPVFVATVEELLIQSSLFFTDA